MNRRFLPVRWLTACGLLLILGWIILGSQNGPRWFSPSSTTSPSRPDTSDVRVQVLGDKLREAGWSDDAAGQVANLNAEWFALISEENEASAQKQLKFLEGLGQHSEFMDFLEEHPETAGLLAAADDPAVIHRSLVSAGEDYDFVASLYVQHAAPEDAALLAEALDRHRTIIGRVARSGMPGAELPFLFRRGNEGSEEYDRWLAEAWNPRITDPDEERAAFQVFLLDQGPMLRRRLKDDYRFRAVFRSELWPKLSRVAGPTGGWVLYVGEPYLWDLLSLPEGERLLERHGRLPILLLFEEGAYPSHLRDDIIRNLLNDDNLILQALVKFRNRPSFVRLLERKLPRQLLDKAAARLLAAGSDYPRLLDEFERLSESALTEALGPPPDGLQTWLPLYDVYYVGKKLVQGRDPDAMDWILATADAATTFLPAIKIGGKAGGTVVKAGAKDAAEQAFKTSLKQEGKTLAKKQFTRELTRNSTRLTVKEATEMVARVAERGLDHELAHFGITSVLIQVQQSFKQALLKATSFEVTQPVRFLFTYSGVSRQTFKRLTGLEARLFMRHDAKIHLRLGNTVLGTAASKYINGLNDQLADQALDATVNARQVRAWRQQVGAWWLANAGDLGVN